MPHRRQRLAPALPAGQRGSRRSHDDPCSTSDRPGCCSINLPNKLRRDAPNRTASKATSSSNSSGVTGRHSSSRGVVGHFSPSRLSTRVIPQSAKPIRSYTGPPTTDASSTDAQPWAESVRLRNSVIAVATPASLEPGGGGNQADPTEACHRGRRCNSRCRRRIRRARRPRVRRVALPRTGRCLYETTTPRRPAA